MGRSIKYNGRLVGWARPRHHHRDLDGRALKEARALSQVAWCRLTLPAAALSLKPQARAAVSTRITSWWHPSFRLSSRPSYPPTYLTYIHRISQRLPSSLSHLPPSFPQGTHSLPPYVAATVAFLRSKSVGVALEAPACPSWELLPPVHHHQASPNYCQLGQPTLSPSCHQQHTRTHNSPNITWTRTLTFALAY